MGKRQMKWPCEFYIKATMPNKKNRSISFMFDGYKDALSLGEKEFRKRVKKPYLWYGVGFTITTPTGHRIEGVFEDDIR